MALVGAMPSKIDSTAYAVSINPTLASYSGQALQSMVGARVFEAGILERFCRTAAARKYRYYGGLCERVQ